MAAVGRGRGRGRGAFQLKSPPQSQQPGSQAGDATLDNQLSSISAALQALPMKGADISSLVEQASNYAKEEEERIEAVVKLVYLRGIQNWHFCHTAALICNSLCVIDMGGTKFRTKILQTVQKDFKYKDELRQSNNKKFLGCVAFLCQLFGKLRVLDSGSGTLQPMKALYSPVYEAVETLLDAGSSEEEMECGTTLVSEVGQLLNAADKNRYRLLINLFRDKILDNKGPRELRAQMIAMIEQSATY